MKKTMFTFVALIALTLPAVAQDTVPMNGMVREGYYYNDYYNRFVNAELDQLGDVADGGEWAKRFVTDDTLTVYGIAVGIRDGLEFYVDANANPSIYIYDTSYEHAYEFLRLYEPYPDSLHCTHQLKLHLHQNPVAYYAYYTDTLPTDRRNLVAMYERYFNVPTTVTDTFFVGMTFRNGARHEGIDDTYIPLMLRLLKTGSALYGDYRMYYGPLTNQWYGLFMRGHYYLIFPILLPAPDDYVWDTIAVAADTTMQASDTVAAGDTLIVCDTVVVCDTLIVGYDTIVRYDTIVNYDTLLALPEHGLLGRLTGVMPNPAAETAKVVSSFGLTMVEVFNMAGEKVHTLRLPDAPLTATLDVRRWPSGTYLLRIHTPLGTAVKKLVKK